MSLRCNTLMVNGSPIIDGNVILTITDIEGTALITTAAAHGLLDAEDRVLIRGTSSASYNNTSDVVAVVSATTFHIGTSYVDDATGGRWDLV